MDPITGVAALARPTLREDRTTLDWTCRSCGERCDAIYPDLMNHIRLMHPDANARVEEALAEAIAHELAAPWTIRRRLRGTIRSLRGLPW